MGMGLERYVFGIKGKLGEELKWHCSTWIDCSKNDVMAVP
jgi:hypothetical protein